MFNTKNKHVGFRSLGFTVVVLALSSAVASCTTATEAKSSSDDLVQTLDDLHAFVTADTSRCDDITKVYDSIVSTKQFDDQKVSIMDKMRARSKALSDEGEVLSKAMKEVDDLESLAFFGVYIEENSKSVEKAQKRMVKRVYDAHIKARDENLPSVEKDYRRRHAMITTRNDIRAQHIKKLKEVLDKHLKK